MTTYKNTSGDYTITLANGVGNLTVNGNLDVQGNVTYIHTSDLKIDDPFITVAANNTGVITSMGMLAQTANTTYAGIRYNSSVGSWQVSGNVYANGNPVSSYANISTNAIAGSNTQIQYNNSGAFGASANLTFDFSSNKLTLSGHMAYGNIGSSPSSVANAVVAYNKVVDSGATGLWVISSAVDDELISATQAKKFAIIL